jgi:hypothetical protein
MKRIATASAAVVCFVAFSVTVAAAAWTKPGAGNAAAKADLLAKPVGTAAPLSSTSIRVSWPAPTSGAQLASTYVVRRVSPSATVCTIAQPETTTTCDDGSLTASTLYNYTIEATLGTSWTSGQSTQFSATTQGTPNFLVTFAVGPYTAGTATTVTLTARNGTTTDTTYTGSHTIVWSGLANSPGGTAPTYPTGTVLFASGVSTTTLNVTMRASGSNTLTATESTRTGSATVTVGAALASAFTFTSSFVNSASVSCNNGATLSAGVGNIGGHFDSKVSVLDAFGNTAVAGAGGLSVTLSLASTANYTLTNAPVSITAGSTESTTAFTVTHANNANNNTTVATTNSGFSQASCVVTK